MYRETFLPLLILTLTLLVGCGRIRYDRLSFQTNQDASPDADANTGADGSTGSDASSGADCQTLATTIQTAQDDGSFDGTIWNVNGEAAALFFGHWNTTTEYGYFRFQLPSAIAPGSTITSASLSFWGVTTGGNWNTALQEYIQINVEESANAAVVANFNQYPNGSQPRVLAAPVVRWPTTGALPWNLNTWNTSSSVAPLLQHLVDTYGGLAANAHVQFWLGYPFGPTAYDADVGTEDRSRNGGHEAKLNIGWCP